MDFHLPGFHAGLAEVRIPADHPTRSGELLEPSRIWHAVTPAKRRTTNYFFAMSSIDHEGRETAKNVLKPVLDEDAFATAEIEKMLSNLDEISQELKLKSDATEVIGRRALQSMMDQEQPKELSGVPLAS